MGGFIVKFSRNLW